MATEGLINRYFCQQCGLYIDDDDVSTHLQSNPTHGLSLVLTSVTNYLNELADPSSTSYGFVDENNGTRTLSFSGSNLQLTTSGSDETVVNISDLIASSGSLYQTVQDLNATTSGILDDKIENVFSFGVDSQGFSTLQGDFDAKGHIIYAGSDKVGTPNQVSALLSVSNTNASVEFRVYDVTNASVITTVTGTGFSTANVPTIFLASGTVPVSSDIAIWEMQIRKSAGNGTVYCHGFSISS